MPFHFERCFSGEEGGAVEAPRRPRIHEHSTSCTRVRDLMAPPWTPGHTFGSGYGVRPIVMAGIHKSGAGQGVLLHVRECHAIPRVQVEQRSCRITVGCNLPVSLTSA